VIEGYLWAQDKIRKSLGWLGFANGGEIPQYRQVGGPIVRTAQQNAPTTSQVAQGYLWLNDKINKGLSWFGFSNGGVVPQYLAEGGVASPYPYRQVSRDEVERLVRRHEELNRLARESESHQTGSSFSARDKENLTRQLRERAALVRAELSSAGIDPADPFAGFPSAQLPVTPSIQPAPVARYSVIGGGLSGAALAGAETSAANAVRRRPVVQTRRLPSPADLQRAAENRVTAASVQTFNRSASFANSRVRRPGEEGQRNIAVRNLSLQQEELGRRLAARRFATGGPVHGAGVGDTVPSLLTNGEFVLNQNATARAGVHNLQRFNSGGPVGHVSYLANGGAVTSAAVGGGELKLSTESERAMSTLGAAFNQFVQQVGGFTNAAQSLSQTFNVFAGHAQALSQALSSFPRVLSGQFSHQVTVVHNGAEVFAKLTPFIEQVVAKQVNATLGRAFKEVLPDAGVSVTLT
jgi:hypothetical protein